MKFFDKTWLMLLTSAVTIALIVVLGWGLSDYIQGIIAGPAPYNILISYTNPITFTYDQTAVSIDAKGTRLMNYNDSALVTGLNRYPLESAELVGFVEHSNAPQGASISYQLTTDYAYWWYYNGTGWVIAADDCETCFNSAAEVSEHIGDLPINSSTMRMRVRLQSDGETIPVLYSVEVLMDRAQFFGRAIPNALRGAL